MLLALRQESAQVTLSYIDLAVEMTFEPRIGYKYTVRIEVGGQTVEIRGDRLQSATQVKAMA